jgi:hypothetical protein
VILMRKINLVPYSVGSNPYDVRGSIINLLFAHGLGPEDLIAHNDLAMKIESAEDSILVDENEYSRIKFCLESFPQGFNRNDLEFVTRIIDAEEITMED